MNTELRKRIARHAVDVVEHSMSLEEARERVCSAALGNAAEEEGAALAAEAVAELERTVEHIRYAAAWDLHREESRASATVHLHITLEKLGYILD